MPTLFKLKIVFTLLVVSQFLNPVSQAQRKSNTTNTVSLPDASLFFRTPLLFSNGGNISGIPNSAQLSNIRQLAIIQALSQPNPQGNDSEQLNFPNLPRVWAERAKLTTDIESTYINAVVPWKSVGVNGQYKFSTQMEYSIKTTFVMVAPDISGNSSGLTQVPEEAIVATGEDLHAYPQVSKKFPMIGFCSYEMGLESKERNSYSIGMTILKYFGIGGSKEHEDNNIAKVIRFSKFFQLDSKTSVSSYLEGVCKDQFTQSKKAVTEKEFVALEKEVIYYHNPNSKCTPTLDKPSEITPQGDKSCFNWYYSQVQPYMRNKTIPRCEIQSDGAHRCVLKSKEGQNCPIFGNRQNGDRSVYYNSQHRVSLTVATHESPCDEFSGLTCKMVEEPKYFLLGVPTSRGEARCFKK